MRSYELIFEIETVTDEVEDRLSDHFDSVLARHGSVTLLGLDAEGVSAEQAALGAASELRAVGVQVIRLYEDLVSRSMIASRVGITPQAVGLWIRGERLTDGSPFPAPFNLAAGGLWLWSEVNTWLQQSGQADGMAHPDRVDYVHVNEFLVNRRSIGSIASVFAGVRTTPAQSSSLDWPSLDEGASLAPAQQVSA